MARLEAHGSIPLPQQPFGLGGNFEGFQEAVLGGGGGLLRLWWQWWLNCQGLVVALGGVDVLGGVGGVGVGVGMNVGVGVDVR